MSSPRCQSIRTITERSVIMETRRRFERRTLLSPSVKTFVARGMIEIRKSCDTLAVLVIDVIDEDPQSISRLIADERHDRIPGNRIPENPPGGRRKGRIRLDVCVVQLCSRPTANPRSSEVQHLIG